MKHNSVFKDQHPSQHHLRGASLVRISGDPFQKAETVSGRPSANISRAPAWKFLLKVVAISKNQQNQAEHLIQGNSCRSKKCLYLDDLGLGPKTAHANSDIRQLMDREGAKRRFRREAKRTRGS
jgi:hypothetical protein